MPGLSIFYKKHINLTEKENFNAVLQKQNILENYFTKILVSEDDLVIGCNIYDDYPIFIEKRGKVTLIVEGKIYNNTPEDVVKELFDLLTYRDELRLLDDIKVWLKKNDGDFIVCAYNHDNKDLLIFNDVFGRLPVYYFREGNQFVVSRYLKVITELNNKILPDKMSLSQILLLGYPLGKRTLYKNINQISPASLIINNENNFKELKIFHFNFEERKYKNTASDEIIETLAAHFSEACNNRFSNGKENLLTLSGGLDSRLIAATLNYNKIPFKSATINYSYGSKVKDEEIAKKVAALFNSNIVSIDLNPPIGKELYIQLLIKEGMNSLFTSQLIPFYKKIYSIFGANLNFITGDNGDRLIYSLNKPIKKLKSLEETAKYILDEHSIFDLNLVNKLTGISQEEILNEIILLLATYPENDFAQKYVHFRTVDKPHKYAFQGEDRHRHFFWTNSPFWSFPFYNYIMNCSDYSKRKFLLFSELIEYFSKESIRIPYANFNSSVKSLKGKIILFWIYNYYSLVPSNIKNDFKALFFGGNPKLNRESILIKCIKTQTSSSNPILEYINLSNEIDIYSFRKVQLYSILTLTSSLELFLHKKSSLGSFLTEEFF